MLLVKGARKGHARDSHFLLHAILDYLHKNVCDFEGTRKLVTHEHQVAFELYRIQYANPWPRSNTYQILLLPMYSCIRFQV